MDNLKEIDKFLKKNNLENLIQEKIENLNGPTTSTEIKTAIKLFPKIETQDYMAAQVSLTKNLKTS